MDAGNTAGMTGTACGHARSTHVRDATGSTVLAAALIMLLSRSSRPEVTVQCIRDWGATLRCPCAPCAVLGGVHRGRGVQLLGVVRLTRRLRRGRRLQRALPPPRLRAGRHAAGRPGAAVGARAALLLHLLRLRHRCATPCLCDSGQGLAASRHDWQLVFLKQTRLRGHVYCNARLPTHLIHAVQ